MLLEYGRRSEAAVLEHAGLVARAGRRLVLTRAGRLLANDVTARLLSAGDASRGASAAAGTR